MSKYNYAKVMDGERIIEGRQDFGFYYHLKRYDFAKRYVKEGMNILDIGCGTGYGSRHIYRKGVKILGVDIHKDTIKYAQDKYGNKDIHFKAMDAQRLKVDKKFDLILAFEIVEHLKEYKQFLSGLKEHMNKNAILVISTPNKKITDELGVEMFHFHFQEFYYAEFVELLEKYFEVKEVYGQKKSSALGKNLIKKDKSITTYLFKASNLPILKQIKNLFPKMTISLSKKFSAYKCDPKVMDDISINKKNVKNSEAFVAVCIKK